MEQTLLEMRGITKKFPGVLALDGVDFTLKSGSVHALMGENGAGKSTLMKCLFGIYRPDAGAVFLEGEEVRFDSAADALQNGVAMVHQELNQALQRSVMDNLWLGRYPARAGFVRQKKMLEDTKKIFDDLHISVDPKIQMSRLPVAKRQMVEIAKAVSYDAKVLVFDEPTSSLTEQEVEHLFAIIDTLKKRGCGIVYISHKMEEILRICDTVTVMRDGRHIATEPAETLTMDKIIRLMVGRDLSGRFPDKTNTVGAPLLTVKNLSSKYSPVRDVHFTAHRGEIVGLAGLAGAGRTEMLENIFGIAARKSGEIFLAGREVKNKNPREAIQNGFALLTEERRHDGIFGILDITANTTVSNLKCYRAGPFLSGKKMRADSAKTVEALRVKTASLKTKIATLSGGNQQKVILGRWLLTEPQVLLLDEPTRGIDVGAKFEIYRLIIRLAERGCAIVMASSELPELLGVCDRIVVMSGGRVAGEVDAKTATQEDIMALAAKYV